MPKASVGHQLELFPGHEHPRGHTIRPHEDNEHFDFLCGCGCHSHNLPYLIFPCWRDPDGSWWIMHQCPNCRAEVNCLAPKDEACS